jgi:hypothetical protein
MKKTSKSKHGKMNKIIKFFKDLKESKGITCIRCGNKTHYYVATIRMHTCKKCKHRSSLKCGTVMQSSKLSMETWYKAFELISISKKGISAAEMQRHLKLKHYKTAFLLMQKIRNMMSLAEIERYFDSQPGYILTEVKMDIKDAKERKKCHKVMINNEINYEGKYQISLIAYDDLNIYKPDKNAKLGLARSRFGDINDLNERTLFTNYNDSDAWVRIHYENFERSVTGIYHGISIKYRQLYMDEFCFKTNISMMKKDLFAEMLSEAVKQVWWANPNILVQTNT